MGIQKNIIFEACKLDRKWSKKGPGKTLEIHPNQYFAAANLQCVFEAESEPILILLGRSTSCQSVVNSSRSEDPAYPILGCIWNLKSKLLGTWKWPNHDLWTFQESVWKTSRIKYKKMPQRTPQTTVIFDQNGFQKLPLEWLLSNVRLENKKHHFWYHVLLIFLPICNWM